MIAPALFSSAKEDWATPQDLFDRLNEKYRFTLDVCASPENAKCAKYFTKEQDGLSRSWAGETCWMNCPYGRGITGKWVEKAFSEALSRSVLTVCLLPARTDTQWFHRFVLPHSEITFLPGRLKFGNAAHAAPFPSLLAVFRG